MSAERVRGEPEVVYVLVNRTRNGKNRQRKLHLPGDGGPLCGTTVDDFLGEDREYAEKPIECYPPAWRDWCDHCLAAAGGGGPGGAWVAECGCGWSRRFEGGGYEAKRRAEAASGGHSNKSGLHMTSVGRDNDG